MSATVARKAVVLDADDVRATLSARDPHAPITRHRDREPDVCDARIPRPTPGGPAACSGGDQASASGHRRAGAAAAVAATHRCGSHHGAFPCMPTGGLPADRMPTSSVADAGDGVPYNES